MRVLEVGLHNVALVAVLDNMDLRLGADSSAGSKARQRLSKQRVLEIWYQVSLKRLVQDIRTHPW
jgi:hypothetical protein